MVFFQDEFFSLGCLLFQNEWGGGGEKKGGKGGKENAVAPRQQPLKVGAPDQLGHPAGQLGLGRPGRTQEEEVLPGEGGEEHEADLVNFCGFFLFGATRLRKNLASFLPLSLFFLSRARKGGKGEARVSLSLALSLSSSSQFPPLEERERRKKEDEVEKRGNEKKPYLSLDQANALMPSKLLPLSPLLARLSLPPLSLSPNPMASTGR